MLPNIYSLHGNLDPWSRYIYMHPDQATNLYTNPHVAILLAIRITPLAGAQHLNTHGHIPSLDPDPAPKRGRKHVYITRLLAIDQPTASKKAPLPPHGTSL